MARPRVKGEEREDLTALMAARERMPCCRLSASRREAIASARRAGRDGRWGGDGVGVRYVERQLGRTASMRLKSAVTGLPGPAHGPMRAPGT